VFSDLNLTITDARREAIEALEGSDHFDMAETRVSQTEIWRRYAGYPFVLSAHPRLPPDLGSACAWLYRRDEVVVARSAL
jgi:hypothetical protein